MEIDQLRHFVAVAKQLSFTRAALDCYLSQPALSRSIQRLEQDLGRPLFERINRGVTLTAAGHTLLPHAQEVLARTAEIRRALEDDGRTGVVRVGAIPTIAPYLLPGLIRSFVARFPEARVQVREDVTRELLRALEEGQLDLAVMARPVASGTLAVHDLYREELSLVLPRAHALARRRTIQIADLAEYPMILLESSHCLTGNVLDICSANTLAPVSVERANQISMVQELVSLGHGISFIPRLARDRDTARDRVYRSLASPQPARTVVSVQCPRRYRTRLVQAFDDDLRRYDPFAGTPRSDVRPVRD